MGNPTMWFPNRWTQIRLYTHRSRLEARNGLKKKSKCTIRVAKTKTLISFVITAKLICVFVFAYADCWFSHEAALLMIESNSVNFLYIMRYLIK